MIGLSDSLDEKKAGNFIKGIKFLVDYKKELEEKLTNTTDIQEIRKLEEKLQVIKNLLEGGD